MGLPVEDITELSVGYKLTPTEKAYDYHSTGRTSPRYTKIVCSKTTQVRFHPSNPRKRILYQSNLIATAKSTDKPVFLCGSEEKADRIFEWGKVGTTTIVGIKDGLNAWKPAYTKTLTGIDVIILYTEKERAGALEIARELLGKANSILSTEIETLDITKEEFERRITEAKAHTLPEEYHEWELSDLGNGRRLAHWAQGDHKYLWDSSYNKYSSGWYSFNGKVWKNGLEEVERLANEAIRNISLEVANSDNPDIQKALEKHAKSSQQGHKKKNMIQEARSVAGMDIKAKEFDEKKGILNVSNGTIDLRTGELLTWNREDYLTAISETRYIPEARAPRWERFVNEICDGDAELVHFLQVLFGYIITGEVNLRHFVILQGNGNNGKSTLVETIASVLGSQYSSPIPSNTYYGKTKTGAPDAVLAGLKVFRLVYGSEGEPGERLSTGKCKWMCGNDLVNARKLFDPKPQIYAPQFTPLLLTNPLPRIDDETDAFWGRLILIPFKRDFRAEGLDKSLKEDLAKEKSGILNWLVKGAKYFYADNKSLPACSVVEQAGALYRTQEDELEQFIQEECYFDAEARCRPSHLRERFNYDRSPLERWGKNHFYKKFGQKMAKIGEKQVKKAEKGGHKTYYLGIGLKPKE